MIKLTEVYYRLSTKDSIPPERKKGMDMIEMKSEKDRTESPLSAILPDIDFEKNNVTIYYSIEGKTNHTTANKIIQKIVDYTEINRNLLLSTNRKQAVLVYRQMAMYFISKHTTLSLASVGEVCGNGHAFDHATIIHAKKVVRKFPDTFSAEDVPYNGDFRYFEKFFNDLFLDIEKVPEKKKILKLR